jgi:hypothetical protein
MPIAQRILDALNPGDKLSCLSGVLGKLSRIAGALAQDPVLVQ